MGEGLYAYRTEYKMTTTMLVSSSSSSLVYLRRVLAMSLTATRSYSSVGSFVVLSHGCAWSCRLWALVTLSLVGIGRSTAIVGRIRCCWVVDVVPWVLAIVCHSLSSLHVAFDWAVVVCRAAGLFVVGVV